MPKSHRPATDFAYQRLANQLRDQIETGQLAPGARMPSVRSLNRDSQLSKSTVLRTYTLLEADGLVEARPRSGFFVAARPSSTLLKTPAQSQPSPIPAPVSAKQVLVDIMQQGAAFDLLASAVSSRKSDHPPAQEGFSEAENLELRRCLARAQRQQNHHEQLYYDRLDGSAVLRHQLAQRMALAGSRIDADDLVITSGCQHALLLALMATTAPGDLVALESPGFYGAFQLLEALGLKALELPSDANTGVNPEALALALEHWDIKAIMLTPNHSTPTGSFMPLEHKRRILELTAATEVVIIEDDIYGELSFGQQNFRPRSLHSLEQEVCGRLPAQGRVILCSSFSKCLSRDLRIGWIAPGRYRAQIQRLKLVTTLASSQTQQLALSEFLSSGGLDKHLRALRLRLQKQCAQLQSLISAHLPMAVSSSHPQGGLSLWLELPRTIDTIALYREAKLAGVSITPGALFSSQDKYQHFLRLSFAHPWTNARIQALQQLGQLIEHHS